MKWPGGRTLRLVCVCLVCLALLACWPSEPDDDDEKEDTAFVVWQIIMPYIWDCRLPDAIDISSGDGWPKCRGGRVPTGLIARSDTGNFIDSASVAPLGRLECRCRNSGPPSGGGGRWYKSALADPPHGYPVTFVYKQVDLFNEGGKLVGVIGLDAYEIGDHLVCVPSRSCDSPYHYQILKIE